MGVIRKSLTRKYFVFLIVAGLAIIGGYYLSSYLGYGFSEEWLFGGLLMFVILAALGFYRMCVAPLGVVMRQVRLLLTGREYKKIFTARTDEVGVLAHFFNEVTRNFEKVSGQLKEREKMQDEMQVASQIQRDVLPVQTPQIAGLDVVAKTRFADDLGGDCFGFIPGEEKYLMYIGDVTGHGLPAALVMMMVSTLLDTYSQVCDAAKDIVVNTNKQLKPRIKATMFMTMLLLSWNSKNKTMSYVGAGHEYLFVYRKALHTVEKIPAGGIALGMVPDNSALVKEVDLKLGEGDVILLFSDGITEARNSEGEMYGEDRLQRSFTEHAGMYGAAGIIHHLAQDFGVFTGDHEQEDDMTMICIKNIGVQASAEVDTSSASTDWSEGSKNEGESQSPVQEVKK